MARCSMCLAILGKCSLIWMPETAVSIALKGPPLACPGFRSKVSIWLGPPFIHRRMHERLRSGLVAFCCATASSQPDSENPTVPAMADNLSASRRDSLAESNMDDGPLNQPWGERTRTDLQHNNYFRG